MDKHKNKRLQSEFKFLQTGLPDGIICSPKGDRLDHYEARIDGPPDSPYENGRFFIDVVLSETYGVDPPSVKFKTRIYHPNIDDHGNICLDILKSGSKGGWKPSWTLDKVLIALRVLLESPNPEDPLMPEIAEQMTSDHAAFTKAAAEWTAQYATAFDDDPGDYIPGSQLGASQTSAQADVCFPKRSVSGVKSPSKAGITKIERRPSAKVEGNASIETKCKLGLSRKSAVPTSESPTSVLPPPGLGKPAGSGMRRLGLSRSRNAAPTKLLSSQTSGPAPSVSPTPPDNETTESLAESIDVSDDYNSGSNSLFIAKSVVSTNSRSSRSPASMKPTKGNNLAEILSLSKSAAAHKRPLKLSSSAPSAETPSPLCPPASERGKKRKKLVDKVQPTPPPSWPNDEGSDELGFLSSQHSGSGGGDRDYECLLDVDDIKSQIAGHLSDTLSESLVGADNLRIDADVGSGPCEDRLDEPIVAGVALAGVHAVVKEPPKDAQPCQQPTTQASFLSDMPQLVPTPEPKAAEVAASVVAAKRKDKGKAADCQPLLPPPPPKRKRGVNDGQVLSESHFGPLDLGLKPIRVSANRSLMRRKLRKSDDAN
ncbi:Ubiquitin-conjugating enzyme E2 T [Coemansia aciculifera]|nr:Ubiquitin-conjugating enzyme E2 T [Coemansia aciculifera]